jgi:hypothetical protein
MREGVRETRGHDGREQSAMVIDAVLVAMALVAVAVLIRFWWPQGGP